MTTPHDTFRDQLLDLAYGELGRREARALRAHLETCAECRGELERMNATRSAMSALGEEPAPERGENVLLAAAREAARQRVRKPFLPAWVWGASVGAVGIAAVAVITLKFGGELRIRNEPDAGALVGSAPARPEPPRAPPAASAAPADIEPPAPPASIADESAGAPPQPEPRGGLAASAPREEGAMGKKDVAGPRAALKRKSGAAPLAKSTPAPAPHGAPSTPPAPSSEADLDVAGNAMAEAKEAPAERELTAQRAEPPRPESAAPAAVPPLATKRSAPAADARSAPYDPIARHARLRVTGELRSATRSFPDCPGESARTVESDRAGAVVKVTRAGTWAGEPFTLEQFYGERGALQAVRFQADGRVREQRLGPGAEGAADDGIPAFALEPRSAAQAGLDAPPRCGP